MSRIEPLGIKKLESLLYYVHDLARVRRFLTERFGFSELGVSSPTLDKEGRQRSAVLRAGDCTLVLCEPIGEGGRAWRYLRKHPEGVGTLVFEVDDIARAFRLLDERGGTMITDIQSFEDDGGAMAMFSITTPLGDTTFRFVERHGHHALYPGYVAHTEPRGGDNDLGFLQVDHVTSNFQTMSPALLWMEHVIGMERYWTMPADGAGMRQDAAAGSGLKSVVMWEPASGIKFANNEPMRPFFKESQINVFTEDHRGDGVQHAALAVSDILGAVRALRGRQVEFMPTPGAYYDRLPERLKRIGVHTIDEDIQTLRELEILVDGEAERSYLLQIFLKEQAGLYADPDAGPFFFEIIQRKGDKGFGAGNLRAHPQRFNA
jgi:4-hydroxyphenylpyruvate dioxygenase